MTPKPVERLEKTLARVAREQGLDQERLRRWVSFLALCGVLECAVEKGVIDIYYLKGGVAMELRFARAARTTKDSILVLEATAWNVFGGFRKYCSSALTGSPST
jgi:hypothetical protein